MADGEVKVRNKPNKYFNSLNQQSHSLRKRLAPRLKRTNDIYITNKSDFKSQLSQCEKLVGAGEDEITLHGIGAAIPRTINLALNFHEKYQETFNIHVETSTVALVDDLEPLTDSVDYESRTRQNSAILIQMKKIKSSITNQI